MHIKDLSEAMPSGVKLLLGECIKGIEVCLSDSLCLCFRTRRPSLGVLGELPGVRHSRALAHLSCEPETRGVGGKMLAYA